MASGTNTSYGLGSLPGGSFIMYADQFLTINGNWSSASSTPAPTAADTNDASIIVRLFDDTTDEGIGLDIYTPGGASHLNMTFIHRAETAPTGAQTSGIDIFTIDDTGAWSATPDTNLTANLPDATEAWQYETFRVALSSTNLVAGNVGQMQINCDGSAGSLTGDWVVRAILFEFE